MMCFIPVVQDEMNTLVNDILKAELLLPEFLDKVLRFARAFVGGVCFSSHTSVNLITQTQIPALLHQKSTKGL